MIKWTHERLNNIYHTCAFCIVKLKQGSIYVGMLLPAKGEKLYSLPDKKRVKKQQKKNW